MWFCVDIAWAEPVAKVAGATVLVEYEAPKAPKEQYTLRITPEGGAPVDVLLLDDGQTPDLQAGDQRFVAFTAFDEVSGTLELKDGAEVIGRGPFLFDNTAMQRLLRVQPVQGVIYAGTALPFNPGDVQPAVGTGPSGRAADAAAPADLRDATWADTAAPSRAPRRLMWAAVALLGVFAAVITTILVVRRRGIGVRELPDRFAAEGLFGSPPLTPGVHLWAVAEGDRVAFLGAASRNLSVGRRLHVVCTDDTPLPELSRGPHHRGTSARLADVADAADTVLVTLPTTARAWRAAAEEGRTVVVLCAPGTPTATAEVTAANGGYRVSAR